MYGNEPIEDMRPYCSIRAAAEAENQESGHDRNCADGAGGDCTCGLIDWTEIQRQEDEERAAYEAKEIARCAVLAGTSKVELGADRWLKRAARSKINRLLGVRGTGGPKALAPMGANRERGMLDRPDGSVARFAACEWCGKWGESETDCCTPF